MGSTIRDTAEAEDRASRHNISWFPVSCVDGDEQWQCEKILFVNLFLLFWFYGWFKDHRVPACFLMALIFSNILN